MLAFRSEAHVERWCEQRAVEPGAVLPLETLVELARRWYAGRADPSWRRRSPAEAQHVFDSLGLTGPFWRLL
jgi:hypothetical protein